MDSALAALTRQHRLLAPSCGEFRAVPATLPPTRPWPHQWTAAEIGTKLRHQAPDVPSNPQSRVPGPKTHSAAGSFSLGVQPAHKQGCCRCIPGARGPGMVQHIGWHAHQPPAGPFRLATCSRGPRAPPDHAARPGRRAMPARRHSVAVPAPNEPALGARPTHRAPAPAR